MGIEVLQNDFENTVCDIRLVTMLTMHLSVRLRVDPPPPTFTA